MVYGELKYFVWYMVNFEETQWYIMKYPFSLTIYVDGIQYMDRIQYV